MTGESSLWLAFAGVMTAQVLATMSPGPSFVIVARKAASSRAEGIAAALAMGVGACVWAAGAMLGLHALLLHFAWLRLVLQVAGGAFLIYVAWMVWRHAPAPLPAAASTEAARGGLLAAFWVGLATQLSNPKVMLFFSSIFVALLPVPTPGWVQGVLLIFIFAVETLWFVTVALAFSNPRLRAAYEVIKTPVDRVTAVVLGALGGKLLLDGLR